MPEKRFLAGDAVILDSITKNPRIIFIKRNEEPFKGMLAFPGGLLEKEESIEECTIREAREEVGIEVEIVSLLRVGSSPKRDPRGVVAVAFVCLSKEFEKARGGKEGEVIILSLEEALKRDDFAADHKEHLFSLKRWVDSIFSN